LRIHTGFDKPHGIGGSSQDLIILTGFKNPHRIPESTQDFRVLTGLRIHTGYEIPRRV